MMERTSSSPRVWFMGACAVSLLVVAVTLGRLWIDVPSPGLDRLLGHLDLYAENNVAVWWSGTLLLLIALHAFDGFFRHRSAEPRRSRAWLAVGLIAAALSLDEVGSLHERVALAGRALGVGGSVALAPFGLVLIGLLAYALTRLFVTEPDRRRFALLMSGFGIVLTVPVLEYLPDYVDIAPAIEAFRARLEEGVEILGMLVLLRAVAANSNWLYVAGVPVPDFEAVLRWRGLALAAGLALTIPAVLITAAEWDGHRGLPANWLGMTFGLLGAFGALRRVGSGKVVWPRLGLALVLVAMSIALVELGPLTVLPLGSVELNLRLGLLALAAAMLALGLWPRRLALYGGAAGLLALFLASHGTTVMSHYLATSLLGLSVFFLASAPPRARLATRPDEARITPAGPTGAVR